MRGGNRTRLVVILWWGVDMGIRVRDRVRGFDDETFAKFARSMQLSLMDGNRTRAHYLVDSFLDEFSRIEVTLEIGDSVAQLVDPETAGLLQGAGYHNIASLVHASDADLLGIHMFGSGRLRKTRAALVAHKFSAPVRKTSVLTAC